MDLLSANSHIDYVFAEMSDRNNNTNNIQQLIQPMKIPLLVNLMLQVWYSFLQSL
jgi:hypothetical protein